jgi:hypothetical protein
MISDEDLSAFAALHDKLAEYGQPWRLTCYRGDYRIELKGPVGGDDIAAEATTLRKLVTALSAALVAASGAPQC